MSTRKDSNLLAQGLRKGWRFFSSSLVSHRHNNNNNHMAAFGRKSSSSPPSRRHQNPKHSPHLAYLFCPLFETLHGLIPPPPPFPPAPRSLPRRATCQVALPFKLLVTLVPICAGVALSTASDTEVSMDGAFWALAGLLAAAGYQVLVKSTQENLKVRLIVYAGENLPRFRYVFRQTTSCLWQTVIPPARSLADFPSRGATGTKTEGVPKYYEGRTTTNSWPYQHQTETTTL